MSSGDLIPLRGAAVEPLFLEVVRDLTAADLADLINSPVTSGPPPLQKLRATHHRCAVLLAEGKDCAEVAAIVGMTPQRVRDLRDKDPAFRELLHYYSDQVISVQLEDSARIRDKLIDVAELAVDEIRDRLEDPEKMKKIPIGEIRQIAAMGLDRTVAPPKATTAQVLAPTQITLNIGNAQPNMVSGVVIENQGETPEDA